MCDTLVVVKSDRVWFAKNSDRDTTEAQLLEWHPAKTYPAGSRVACTWIDIPQVAETNAVVLSRPSWMWGAEIGANDKGVVIGNEAVFTRAYVPKEGLTGMDLLRLALERAKTAEEAVQVIVDLAKRHGQGGSCGYEDVSFRYFSSFLIADATGAFLLETAKGGHTAERVQGVRSISNLLTIEPFGRKHRDPIRTAVAQAARRRRCTEAGATRAGRLWDLAGVLRDHGGEPIRYSPVNGYMAGPCMHAGGLIASSQTTASWISELGPEGPSHFATGTAAPCTSIFKPVRVDRPVEIGDLWWRHERLHRAVIRNPGRLLPLYAEERDELEAGWFEDPPAPGEAFEAAAARTEVWLRRVWEAGGGDVRPWYVRRHFEGRPPKGLDTQRGRSETGRHAPVA